MANRTIAQQITLLETERTALETQRDSMLSGAASFTLGDLSASQSARYEAILDRLTMVEKRLQRLYRGGRGFAIDMSHAATDTGAAATDLGNTTLVTVRT